MIDGKIFQAEFVEVRGSSIVLANKEGKRATFPSSKLSVVDRYYLNRECAVPIEKLIDGEVSEAELDIGLRSSDFKIGESFSYDLERKRITFKSLISPHFILFYENGVRINPFAETLERLWYSHAFRTPGFVDEWGKRRKVFFYIPKGESLKKFAQYYITTFEEELSNLEKNEMTGRWESDYMKARIPVTEFYREEYQAEEYALVEACEFKNKEEYNELLHSYPFFKWQEMFFPGSKLPQKKTDTKSKLVSQKGYVTLIYANELRFHNNENRTYSQYVENGLGVAVPAQGSVKEWGKRLAKLVKDKEARPDLKIIYNDKVSLKSGLKEEKIINAILLMSFGRFLEKELPQMISRCALIDYIGEYGAFPPKEELVSLFGYKSSFEMEEAFEQFILQGNLKHK